VSSVALDRFVEETKELLEPELARFGAVLDVKLDYAGNARFDAGKIRRALWNLARNAAQSGAKKIVWQFARTGEYLVLECCDARPGVPSDLTARLLDALAGQSAWNEAGMGLAIAKKIVDAHCGHIQVKSDTGHGTVFRIELPF
jgi:signal transduction histidine kinase